MLVLTRRNGEKLLMTNDDGIDIEVSILRINGNSVRIGIEAPGEIFILRAEVEEKDAAVREGVGSVRDGGSTR